MPGGEQEFVVLDRAAWWAWLARHRSESAGVWLVLARKGTIHPTCLVYAEALEVAMCFGWIDSQKRSRDDATFRQRFTRTDGRWQAAYAGQASIDVPPDLAAALAAEPRAQAMFDILTSQNRYAVLLRTTSARRADTRARRIEQFVAMLVRGETVHPQRATLEGRPAVGRPTASR